MENVFNFLNSAMPFVRDSATTFVALTGAIVAILTYRRAKETLLQPVRSEVIKRQTDMLIDILSTIGDELNISNKADYQGLIQVNILSSMLRCGAIFKDEEQVKELLKNKVRGASFGEEGARLVELAPIFETKSTKSIAKDKDKQFYDKAKKGEYRIPIIDITGDNIAFLNKLDMYKNNPFLPKKVSELITELEEEIRANITGPLVEAVEKSINESFRNGGKDVPNPSGVYNIYHRKASNHRETVLKIRTEIRQYLKIDSMP